MQLKEFIAESFKKEYAYRVKFAANCGAEQMTQLEKSKLLKKSSINEL